MMLRNLRRYALMGCGWLALGLGVIGLFLPVLPTAPFVLVAAACFMRSSERMHSWIVEHRVFGAHIRDFLAGRGLRRRTKVVALATLWVSITVTAVLSASVVLAIAIIAVASAVSAYILRLPTCAEPAMAHSCHSEYSAS